MSDPGLGTGGWSIGTKTWGVERGIHLPSGLGLRQLLCGGRKGVSTGCDCRCALPRQLFAPWVCAAALWLGVSTACSNPVGGPTVLLLLPLGFGETATAPPDMLSWGKKKKPGSLQPPFRYFWTLVRPSLSSLFSRSSSPSSLRLSS